VTNKPEANVKKQDLAVDVTDAVGTGETLHVTATVVMPDTPNGVAMFGFPGGAYNRHYYDLHLDEGPDYSQAEFHAREGHVFVAIDHLGVGESSVPIRELDYEAVARANNAAANEIRRRFADGTIAPEVAPVAISTAIAMGQSFGGFLLLIAQGNDPCFDAVAILGSSAIQTTPPWPSDLAIEDLVNLSAGNGLTHPMRPWFYCGDVPESIVIADLTKQGPGLGSAAPWSTQFSPGGPAVKSDRNPLHPRVVAKEAAAITAPVFIGNGEVDVVPNFRAEPAAYASSRDVTTCVFGRMYHMHNFASTRRNLWKRLSVWADGVAATKATGP